MKSIIFLILITLSTYSVQSQNIEGTYANKWVSTNGEGIEYVLTLNSEGNFTFNYTRIHLDSNPNEEIEVLGTWKLEGHLLVLNTKNENDTNQKIATGLDLNKARFISVSPRNPNFNLVKPTLQFYVSEIFYAKNMELVKKDDTVSTLE